MHSLNLEGDGRFSFVDLDQALRTAPFRRTQTGTYMSSARTGGASGLVAMSTPRTGPAAAAPTDLIRSARLFGGGPPTVLGGPPPTYHALPLIGGESHLTPAALPPIKSPALCARPPSPVCEREVSVRAPVSLPDPQPPCALRHADGPAGESYAAAPPYSSSGAFPDVQAQLAEILHLRAQLDEARRQAAALREALEQDRVAGGSAAYDAGGGGQPSWDEQQYRTRILDSDLANENALVAKLQQELKGAWERVAMLQRRFDDASSTLATIKANHSRVLQQLEDTSRQLSQERKTAIRAMNEERRLALELDAARELEPSLEQARQDKLALEKENAALMQQAMSGPSAGNSELRKLRAAMAELKREKEGSERSLAELRRDLEMVGGGKPGSMEDYRGILADRNALKSEVMKLVRSSLTPTPPP